MPLEKLKAYLDTHNIKYTSVFHSETFTSQEVAQSAHISGRELAKTVIIKKDGKLAMVVLPASRKVNLELLKSAAGAKQIELADETEFAEMFPDCEIGAMPPFGNLYGMEVFVEKSLADDEEIAFNAGSHIELIKMSYRDYSELVKPKVLAFSSGRA